MILNTAFDIARISGLDKVSNREIAKRLNCSIRPIYYQFRDVQEMNSELIKKIWQYFYDYIFTKRDAALEITLPYKESEIIVDLVQVNLFADGFQVETNTSNGQPVDYTPGVYYQGTIKDDPNSIVAISFFFF